jgi:TDG/mug DNA glycosylase family protein
MDRPTVRIYEERGGEWAARRRPVRREDALAFGSRVPSGAVRADLGCGAGRYSGELGLPLVGIDAARTMLELATAATPGAWFLQADLEALPLRRDSLAAAWANMAYLHVPRAGVPLALAQLHAAMSVGAALDLQVIVGDYEGKNLPSDEVGGRFFAAWQPDALADVLVGAGFEVGAVEVPADQTDVVRARAVRARTLPDTVGPNMRLLVCGLNPSLFAADRGVGYARPGNRFWPAALAAGLVSRSHDPVHALGAHGMGMTDLVKRATARADELSAEEYRVGATRVERLVRWLQPEAVCFVGLTGWRAAVDRGAVPGWQPSPFAGRPAYVMPSTSGLNAHASAGELAQHLAIAGGGNAE